MQHTIRFNTLVLLVGDALVFVGALYLTLLIRHLELPSTQLIELHLTPFVALIGVWLVVFFAMGLYGTRVSFLRKQLPDIVFKAQLVNMLIAAVFFFVLPLSITPKTTLLLYLIISTSLVMVWRLFVYSHVIERNTMRALIIGDGAEAEALARVLNEAPHFRFVHADIIASAADAEMVRRLITEAATSDKDVLIVGDMSSTNAEALLPYFYNVAFTEAHVQFMGLHALYEQIFHRIPLSQIGERWLLEHIPRVPHPFYDLTKRLIDIAGALVLLPIFILLCPLVWLAMRVFDSGSLFIRQERVGQYNMPIHILKFRTMNGIDSNDTALRSRFEVTSLGRILRILRLDEFPQLLNVLRGDLSFIGPRPEIPSLAAVYAEKIPYYNARHLIKPGLSGWAQISNHDVPRGGVDVPRTIAKLSYDLYYLKHRSLLMDIEIFIKTMHTVLSRSGT